MTSKTYRLPALALTAAIVVFNTAPQAFAQTGKANATPFGLEIGVAKCNDARARVGAAIEKKLGDGDVLLQVSNPSALYEGASEAMVRCSGDDRIIAVQFKASKGGMGATLSRETYSGLSRKYRLLAGGPMPQLGNGYARFAAGNSIIEQDAPHLSFDFTVTYYERGFYDGIVASNKEQSQKRRNGRQESL